ncbi:hypothetical protein NL676_028147 [Syzygium grande]|nr:hypothetical protein NL676_028147 [Syzygium grande]
MAAAIEHGDHQHLLCTAVQIRRFEIARAKGRGNFRRPAAFASAAKGKIHETIERRSHGGGSHSNFTPEQLRSASDSNCISWA